MTREEAFERIERCARDILYWSEHAESEEQRLDFLAGSVNGINAAADVLLPDEDEPPARILLSELDALRADKARLLEACELIADRQWDLPQHVFTAVMDAFRASGGVLDDPTLR